MLTPEKQSLPIELRIKCKLDLLPTLRATSSGETTYTFFRKKEIMIVLTVASLEWQAGSI